MSLSQSSVKSTNIFESSKNNIQSENFDKNNTGSYFKLNKSTKSNLENRQLGQLFIFAFCV